MADNSDKKQKAEETLTDLLEMLGGFYKEKVQQNSLSAAEQKNLIQLLRDNQITIDPTEANPLDFITNGDYSFDEDGDADFSVN